MKRSLLLIGIIASLFSHAQNSLNIVPLPAEIIMGKDGFTINKNTTIVLEGSGLEKTAAFLNDKLKKELGFNLKVQKKDPGTNTIRLNYERMDYEIQGAYNLDVTSSGVYLTGDNEEGVFYGMQTLLQLFGSKNQVASSKMQGAKNQKQQTTNNKLIIPKLTISDHPRFAYRGIHLDVGRHLFPVAFIKKYIDYLATYKFNTFHWHLTDDQGWRIEIKKYPLLTQVGGCRDQTLVGRYGSNKYDGKKYCGYYTQQEVKEIVQYAADRYITVIPEIEMPGHALAALTSYPYLGCTKGPYKVMDTWGVLDDVFCAGNDSTYTFMENVLDEVMQLFPSKYIHIGGDECPKERWKKCPVCQKRIRDEKLADEHALQSYFIGRIEKYLNGKGRRIIGWDEIMEGGLAPDATVMSWRGEEGGIEAAKLNHDVIMTPGSHCYLDHAQSANEDSLTIGGYLPLEKVYAYEPIPAALTKEQAKHILGAQGNMWTEYMEYPSKVEYMLFPRIMALSEVLWSPKEKRNWTDFERRLPVLFDRLDAEGINYSKAYFDLKAGVQPRTDFSGVQVVLESKTKGSDIRYRYNTSEFHKYSKPVELGKSVEIGFSLFKNDQPLNISTLKFLFNKATGKKITMVNDAHRSYPGNGAFTLVDGIQNTRGLARSSEFLGFLGKDLDVTIDLGQETDVNAVKLHLLNQNGSWIYLPSEIEINLIPYIDTNIVTRHPPIIAITQKVTDGQNLQVIRLPETKTCRYVRVVAKNFGMIPSGNPGAGNPAWLFADEIEVE